VGKRPHVHADLGDDHLGGGAAQAGDLIQPLHHLSERDDQLLELAVQLGDVSVQRIHPGQHPSQQEPMMVGEEPGERLLQHGELGAQAGPGQLRERLWVALAGDQRGQHRPAGDPEDVAGDHRQLDLGVLQQLLDPLLLRGAHAHQVGAVAGHIPQPADRRWWHEAGPQHLPLGHLAQPYRIQLVGLGPPGQVLDVAGIHQPDLQPVRLQQIEHRLPVVAGGLQHHPGHPQPGQPVGQLQQRAGHRRVGGDLLQPPSPLALAGHPHTAGQLGLADIQRGDPRDELLGVVGLLQHPASLRPTGQQHGCPQEPQGTGGI
jgi:hypothetical protein